MEEAWGRGLRGIFMCTDSYSMKFPVKNTICCKLNNEFKAMSRTRTIQLSGG